MPPSHRQRHTGLMTIVCLSHTWLQCLKWSKKEAGSLTQSEVECLLPRIFYIYFWSENGEFWCILGGILCDLELQESKQQTRYRPGKSKGAGSPTLATRPHCKPCLTLTREWKSVYLAEIWQQGHGWLMTPFRGQKVKRQGHYAVQQLTYITLTISYCNTSQKIIKYIDICI